MPSMWAASAVSYPRGGSPLCVRGSLIAGVAEASAARRAGLEIGDVFIRLNGAETVAMAATARMAVRLRSPPGERCAFRILRIGRAL